MITLIFGGCDVLGGREYKEDIHIPLETRQSEIIIKEWSWGLGSGFEVYYKEDGKEVMLGESLAGDDGFCPFEEGLYQLTQDGNTVTIKWCFNPSEKNQPDKWRSKTFDLPLNDNKGA